MADKIDALRALSTQRTREAELRAATTELRTKRIDVIQRALDHGCSPTEIGATLGMSESAVRKALSATKTSTFSAA